MQKHRINAPSKTAIRHSLHTQNLSHITEYIRAKSRISVSSKIAARGSLKSHISLNITENIPAKSRFSVSSRTAARGTLKVHISLNITENIPAKSRISVSSRIAIKDSLEVHILLNITKHTPANSNLVRRSGFGRPRTPLGWQSNSSMLAGWPQSRTMSMKKMYSKPAFDPVSQSQEPTTTQRQPRAIPIRFNNILGVIRFFFALVSAFPLSSIFFKIRNGLELRTISLHHISIIKRQSSPLPNPHDLELRTISLHQISIIKRQPPLLDQIASLRCRQSLSCTMRSRKRCRGSWALWCQMPFLPLAYEKRGFPSLSTKTATQPGIL